MGRKKSPARMTRGERVCAFIEQYCIVPEGDRIGRPFKLEPFQRRFVLDVYDNPFGTHSAYLSIARKNGKTGLIACSAAGSHCRTGSGPEFADSVRRAVEGSGCRRFRARA